MKHRTWKNLLAVLLSLTLLVGTAALTVSAAEPNLLQDPGMDVAPVAAPDPNPRETGKWYGWNIRSTCTWGASSGRTGAGVALTGQDPSLEQDVAGLQDGKSYVFTIWSKGQAGQAVAGVKNFGGTEIKIPIQSSEDWAQTRVEFTVKGNVTPRVYVWSANMNGGTLYLDDASLVLPGEKPAPGPNAEPEIPGNLLVNNGFEAAAPAGEPGTGHWSVWGNVSRSAENAYKGSYALQVSHKARGGSSSEQDIPAASFEKGATYRLSVWAKLSRPLPDGTAPEIGVKNFSAGPQQLVNPRTDSWQEYTIDFVYESGTPRVFVWMDPSAPSDVVVYADTASLVKIQDAPAEETLLPHDMARDFYVAENGSDLAAGTGEAPLQSIEALNKIRFIPGDRIFFRAGDTFTGTFKPKGSGSAQAPIVISAYGEGKKPVLQPGAPWSGVIMKANGGNQTLMETVSYTGCIWLEDVQYYEVRGLELSDPSYNAEDNLVNRFPHFAAGVRVVNNNQGDLRHFVFDDLTIHGFRGPGSNLGKSSGGIQFNVNVDPDHRNDKNWEGHVPSAMHEITITNCEIFNCGRSGINFLNPWGRRYNAPGETRWNNVNEGILPWHPYTDFYMANNIIHHIDGDGMIVDNVEHAVVENNLCYETAIHLGEMHAAVGFFNWNSNDVTFQYNEVFNIGKDATNMGGSGWNPEKIPPVVGVPGDAQGIEIDALNVDTYVQHNYLHDNRGGFMMWCNVNVHYPGYNGIIRYNISENDHIQNHGLFHSFPFQYGSQTYNNVFYLNPDTAVENGSVKLFNNNGSGDQHRMYNNIFWLAGDRAYPMNKFEDGAYDWQSNLFYNITNLPQNDDPAHPNLRITDPASVFVNPGHAAGSQTPTVIRSVDELRQLLAGYMLADGSPAIQAGARPSSMAIDMPLGIGDRTPLTDFFGNPIPAEGPIDIGIHQSGKVILRLSSDVYPVDNAAGTITVPYGTTAQQLLDGLTHDDAITISLTKEGNAALTEADILTASLDGQEKAFSIAVDKLLDIPAADHTVEAGNAQSNEPARNVLTYDGLWHTNWNGSDRSQHWITLTIPAGKYQVTGLRYLPRQDRSSNGVITSYELYGRSGTEEWTLLSSGPWANDKTEKVVEFTPEQTFDQYKLVSVASVSDQDGKNFTSAQEIRLLGYEKPAAPVIADSGRSLSLDGKIYINHYATITGFGDLDLTQNGGMLFWDHAVTEEEATITSPDAKTAPLARGGSENLYGAQTPGFAAKEYNDSIWMRIYVQDQDGQYKYGELVEYSVRAYCEGVLESETKPQDLKNTCVQLLHFGAAAQVNFGYDARNLANRNIVEAHPGAAWNDSLLTALEENPGHGSPADGSVRIAGKSLSLDDILLMNFYFEAQDFSVTSAELEIWDGSENYTVSMRRSSGSVWGGQTRGIAAKDYGKTVFVQARFTDDAGMVHCSPVVACSPEAYAAAILEKNTNPNLVQTVKAMVLYGEAARQYFLK